MGLLFRREKQGSSVAAANARGPPKSWEPGFWEAQLKQNVRPNERSPATTSHASTIVAPQQQLDALCVSLVLGHLSPRELARAQVVCRDWRELARARAVRIASFQRHWDLASISGMPRTWSVAETATDKSFVRKAPLSKLESLAMLAVRHSTDVTTLKRLNNLTTEMSLHARQYIFVPVAGAAAVRGHHVHFVYCPNACREFLTLAPAEEEASEPVATPSKASLSPAQLDQLTAKLAQMLSRSLHVDEHTARYYLDEADGDMRKAMRLFEQDRSWEQAASRDAGRTPVRQAVTVGGSGARRSS